MKGLKMFLFCMFFFGVVNAGFSAELKFYTPFEEGSGEVTKDKAGGLEGKISGAKWVDGKFGKALYFDGKEKKPCSYVGFAATDKNDFIQTFEKGPFSITCWIKPESTKAYAAQQEILNTADDRGPGWRLTFTWKAIRFTSGTGFPPKGDSWAVANNPSTDQVLLDDWDFIAVVKDKEGILSLYLNGKKVTQSEKPFEITSKNIPLTIGAFQYDDDYGFKGIIDEVKIYKGDLSAGEIYKEFTKE